jgi:hypothetical protein
MAYTIECESIEGNVQKVSGIFPTADDAMEVCERLWNKYAPTERFTRFSILDEKKEVYADYEC